MRVKGDEKDAKELIRIRVKTSGGVKGSVKKWGGVGKGGRVNTRAFVCPASIAFNGKLCKRSSFCRLT